MEFERQIVGRWPADVAEPVPQKGVDDQSSARAQTHEYQPLRKELSCDLKTARAQRLANREFPLPRNATRQRQSGYVKAADYHKQDRGSVQHCKKHEEAAIVAQGGRVRSPSGHRPKARDLLGEVFAANVSGSDNQCLPRLVPRESVTESPEGLAAARVHIRQQIHFRGDTMTQNAAIVARQRTQNCIDLAAYPDRVTNGAGIRVQTLAPEAVADHGDGTPLIGLRVQPAERTADTEDVEEISTGSHCPGNFAVSARIPLRVAEADIEGQPLKNF